jgi:Ca2+-binding EF-hand superfamily protein
MSVTPHLRLHAAKPQLTLPSAKPRARHSQEQLYEWFNAIDKDQNGHLTVVELQSALQLAGMNFSLSTVAHIIRIHDRDNSGTITLDEFQKLNRFLSKIQAAFEHFDMDGNGTLEYNELHMALVHAGKVNARSRFVCAYVNAVLPRATGYTLDRLTLQHVFERFDPTSSGRMELAVFFAVTLFLRSATTTFKAFDPQGTSFITLNFNTFVYACATTM